MGTLRRGGVKGTHGREQGAGLVAGGAGRGGHAAAADRGIGERSGAGAGQPDQLRERLAAIDRALARIEAGNYGLSVLSGKPIPADRLEADPAAELTIEEAQAHR